MKLVQFGAGNIGRSFIGQLFSRAGYQVVFVDIDDSLVAALNEQRRYRVEVKDVQPETIWVERVRAVHGRDQEAVAEELADCDIAATAVGPDALPGLCPSIAQGLLRRRERQGDLPLDIILAENLRQAASVMREGLKQHLPEDYPLDSLVGLVETSIGKMVPIVPDEIREKDPLVVYAEAYNTLILDKLGFRNPIPDVPGLDPKDKMAAYVDRKSFIHNLGHAATAYLGFLIEPTWTYIWQAIEHPQVRQAVAAAMWESGRALIAEYPTEFNEANQEEAIDDLIRRFGNHALGDTIFRVGRDILRKLSPGDRLMGALRLDQKHQVPAPFTALTVAAGMLFRAPDEHGALFPRDAEFTAHDYSQGIGHVLEKVCGLDPTDPDDQLLINEIEKDHRSLVERRTSQWLADFLKEHQ